VDNFFIQIKNGVLFIVFRETISVIKDYNLKPLFTKTHGHNGLLPMIFLEIKIFRIKNKPFFIATKYLKRYF